MTMLAPKPAVQDLDRVDIVVAGAGVVGLVLAIALAREGFSVACLGRSAAARNGRTVALLDGSVRLLRATGVWDALAGLTAPLSVMRIVDDTDSLFRGPPVDFIASEIGLDAFGHNVENADLVNALEAAAERTPGLHRLPALIERQQIEGQGMRVRLADGGAVTAPLLVAADGVRSPARHAAGIAARQSRYPQDALTAVLVHERPHRAVSTEFHTREGPFTLVPLPGSAEGPHRSSLVWVMTPARAECRLAMAPEILAREIARRARTLLGDLRVSGAVGHFPLGRMVAERLVAERLVLAGEAAHALPPIGAQGLNLSLRDAATLVEHLAAARRRGLDIGSAGVLAGYEAARRGDVALRALGVDMLNRSLLTHVLPVDAARGLGLAALAAFGPLRRALMREGLFPQRRVPALMRQTP